MKLEGKKVSARETAPRLNRRSAASNRSERSDNSTSENGPDGGQP